MFSRSAKEIPLSAEMQALLGLKAPQATPQLIMNTILKMPVDLLWFGGIGTYVRAPTKATMPRAIAPTIRSASPAGISNAR